MAEIGMVHVPYRGLAPALTDLIGGRVQAIFSTTPPVICPLRMNVVAYHRKQPRTETAANGGRTIMPLSAQEITELRQLSEQHKQALLETSQNVVSLWKSRFDMALVTKDDELINEMLGGGSVTPAYLDKNTNCGGCRPR